MTLHRLKTLIKHIFVWIDFPFNFTDIFRPASASAFTKMFFAPSVSLDWRWHPVVCFLRYDIGEHGPHALPGPGWERDPRPGRSPVPRWSSWEPSRFGVSHRGMDGAAELWLRGLRTRPLRRRPEQRCSAHGRDPEGSGGEAVLLQGSTQAVPEQPVSEQRHLQRGMESICMRLRRYGVSGTFLRERWVLHTLYSALVACFKLFKLEFSLY